MMLHLDDSMVNEAARRFQRRPRLRITLGRMKKIIIKRRKKRQRLKYKESAAR